MPTEVSPMTATLARASKGYLDLFADMSEMGYKYYGLNIRIEF